MEPLTQEITASIPLRQASEAGYRVRRALWCGTVLAVLGLAGCVHAPAFLVPGNAPPTGAVCQIVSTWNPKVVFTPDPVRGGVESPGLAGRLYLFGAQIDYPLVGDGSLSVDLYDETPRDGKNGPVLLEKWEIDKDTLKRLLRRDTIGWGYTLFLPWGTYSPQITQVNLYLKYTPAHATPMYTNSGPVTLNKDERGNAVPAREGPVVPRSAPSPRPAASVQWNGTAPQARAR